ncbi:hypothetical protein F3157_18150 [Virgibacillus dakarensis]|uniref:Uncharacterized protein n=1 Tax=Lentibacillus populi TaxID=1827502 RepID=A0A9W5TX48_9BACI|nr:MULTISPECIES: hypothetical protein [Bacillaceae]MBT2214561.1 hypothetical protein [Virgibacillus dakarensis]MTW87544.1 hypothetical protein [Virgibacillus dakarensis]GGB40853.1 hypothetical protein GCM10011409_17950 [Lentibacillus populi]
MIINAEQPGFRQEEVKKRLEKLDPETTYKVQRLVFYPYMIFEYVIDRRNFFHPLKGHVGCTIDGVNKVGALADTFPQLMKQEVSDRDFIQPDLTLADAKERAEDFLYHSLSSKKKILTIPKLTLTKQEIFYRPYWIVEGILNLPNHFFITVDAVSGKFHPL